MSRKQQDQRQNKVPLFTVPRSAFRLSFFRASGPGGQKQNKTSSACRIAHPESGATGECREERHQHANRKRAFHRLVASKTFQNWLRVKAAAVLQGFRDIEDKVDRMLRPANLKVEHLITYQCDRCGRREQRDESKGLPERWRHDPPDTHYCGTCA